jgi:hypothetical protein
MDYITTLHDIIKPLGTISTIDNRVIIEYSDIKLVMSVTETQIEISSTDYLSFHILRLIINKLSIQKDIISQSSIIIGHDIISEFFIALKEIFENNYYDYCTICSVMHDNQGLNYITSCLDPECVNKLYHYPINNKITENYKSDSNTLILLFKSFLSAIMHPKAEKIITTLPKIHSITKILTLKDKIPKILLDNNLDDIIKIISESYDDFFLWIVIGI